MTTIFDVYGLFKTGEICSLTCRIRLDLPGSLYRNAKGELEQYSNRKGK